MDMVDFVIGRFTKDEIPVLEKAIIKTSDAVIDIIENGIAYAMNKHNTKA